jgi:hypothetical protein
MNQTQVTDNRVTFTPEDTETRFEEIVPPSAVRVAKHTASHVCPCCVYEMRRVKQMTVFEDKRSEKRIACNNPVPIQISFFNSERFVKAQVVDHCMNGVSIISNQAFLPGLAIILRVAYSTTNGSCSTDLEILPSVSIGEVKWCRKLPAESSTTFGVGVRYFPHVY